jgi:pyruvate formate lyase activating enzyme
MFVDKCKSLNKKLWLRQVIVPGINDDEAHVLALKQFAGTLNNVERIELLPYHTMGVHKYNELGLNYKLDGVTDMDKEKCKQLEELLK